MLRIASLCKPNILQFLGVVLGKVCCFGEADTKGEFSQIGMNIPFDRQNDMAPIVTDTAQPDEHQGHPSEVRPTSSYCVITSCVSNIAG